jgi:acyl-homoserine lactone synthase
MIHIITATNRHLFEREMLEYFRLRHEIFVDERGWRELAQPDGLERDQFDNDDAMYIIGIDGERVYGGSRLISTMKPHLLGDVFTHLAPRGVPRDPTFLEWTRVFVTKDRREGRNAGRTAGAVICGLLEFCLEEGIQALTGVIDAWWIPRFHGMGWTVHPLGPPELAGGDWVVAVTMPIDEGTLASTQEFHGIQGSVLVRRGLARPAIPAIVQ